MPRSSHSVIVDKALEMANTLAQLADNTAPDLLHLASMSVIRSLGQLVTTTNMHYIYGLETDVAADCATLDYDTDVYSEQSNLPSGTYSQASSLLCTRAHQSAHSETVRLYTYSTCTIQVPYLID